MVRCISLTKNYPELARSTVLDCSRDGNIEAVCNPPSWSLLPYRETTTVLCTTSDSVVHNPTSKFLVALYNTTLHGVTSFYHPFIHLHNIAFREKIRLYLKKIILIES